MCRPAFRNFRDCTHEEHASLDKLNPSVLCSEFEMQNCLSTFSNGPLINNYKALFDSMQLTHPWWQHMLVRSLLQRKASTAVDNTGTKAEINSKPNVTPPPAPLYPAGHLDRNTELPCTSLTNPQRLPSVPPVRPPEAQHLLMCNWTSTYWQDYVDALEQVARPYEPLEEPEPKARPEQLSPTFQNRNSRPLGRLLSTLYNVRDDKIPTKSGCTALHSKLDYVDAMEQLDSLSSVHGHAQSAPLERNAATVEGLNGMPDHPHGGLEMPLWRLTARVLVQRLKSMKRTVGAVPFAYLWLATKISIASATPLPTPSTLPAVPPGLSSTTLATPTTPAKTPLRTPSRSHSSFLAWLEILGFLMGAAICIGLIIISRYSYSSWKLLAPVMSVSSIAFFSLRNDPTVRSQISWM
jgi:hypothetical protein